MRPNSWYSIRTLLKRDKIRVRESYVLLKCRLTEDSALRSVVAALLIGTVIWSIAYNAIEVAASAALLGGLLLYTLGHADFGVELIGITLTVLLIDRMYEHRATEQEKRALILQMGSPNNAFAVEATRILKVRGWLTDGSLRGADLGEANLRGAYLDDANLYRADLKHANLQGATLMGANLQGGLMAVANLEEALLMRANLQGASLTGTNLQGADLEDANLREASLAFANLQQADLSTAHNLDLARLDGARANSETKWPEGFMVPHTVMMVKDL